MRAEKNGPIKFLSHATPWFALAISLISAATWLFPRLHEALLYDRSLISSGQWWRFYSGHFTHHSTSHLAWNLAVFLPAAVWLERLWPRAARWFLVLSPLVISGALWWLDLALQFYAGLSGVTMGVLTLLVLLQLRAGSADEPRWLWWCALALLAVKIAVEFRQPANAMFASLPAGIRNVPLAHLAGAVFAAAFAFAVPGKRKRD